MKKIFYFIITLMVMSMVSPYLTSCKSAKLKDADEAYERGEYNQAANIYRKVYNKLSKREDRYMRGEVAFSMGECYRHLNQSARALAAYQNAIRYENPDSMAIFYLAQAQHMEGQYAAAMKNYEAFLEKRPGHYMSIQGIRACRLAPKWKEEGSRYQVKTAKLFNSRRADFCPMFLDVNADQLYFTSSNEKATGDAISEITGAKNCDIFFSKKDEKGRWERPAPAEGDLNTEFDEGITSFSPDGSTMYLAKCIRKTDSGSAVEIYTSQRSEAKWSAPVKFEITADTISSVGDPAVSFDGNYLYFSSDMPGGQGGKDLWRIDLKDKRGTLINLGEQINTPGDERFPYSRGDSILYFSSNGHPGFGGLDLFKATLQPSGNWHIENLGAPMNSSADDFGITFAGAAEEGFFSSNRKDGRGYDHIFSFVKPVLKVWISGYVLDKDEEPVPNAVIRIVGNDGSNQKAVAKPDGSFRFDLQRGVNYVMLAGANGYLNTKQEFASDIQEEDAEYNVDFILAAMTKPQVIDNIFYDYNKATLRPESKKALDEMVQIMNDNPYITIEMASHTDRVGSHEYNNSLSSRRAKSVVDYLVEHGIQRERMRPHGYGKTVPKVVTKRINRLYPQFAIGDTLNVAYTDTLSKENRAIADQINRRTEFMVLTTNFQPFVEDIKRHEEEGVPLDSLPKRNEAPDANGILMESKDAPAALNQTPDSLSLTQNADSLEKKEVDMKELDKKMEEKLKEKEAMLKEGDEKGSGGSRDTDRREQEADREGKMKIDADAGPRTKITPQGSKEPGKSLPEGKQGSTGNGGLKGNSGGSNGKSRGHREGIPINRGDRDRR